MTTWVTICETCKREDWEARKETVTDGDALAALVESQEAPTGVKVRRHPCLMGCGKGCNVAIQSDGKLCYTLGGFEATSESAEAILAYAGLHADSETGQVPYKQWPQGVKGHFVTRHPPLPK